MTLRDRALATSGGYGTPIDAAGRYTHLFDPRDGNARPRYRSVSVMAPTATAADALSTAFSHMPLEDAKIARSLGLRAWFHCPTAAGPGWDSRNQIEAEDSARPASA